MPTKEQQRRRRRYLNDKQLLIDSYRTFNRSIVKLFPLLNLDYSWLLQSHDPNEDYGLHILTLNFPKHSEPDQVFGSVRFGLAYDRDSKAKYEGRAMCLVSEKNIDVLYAARHSLVCRFNIPMNLNHDKLRLNFIVGAKTLPHNDNFRGPTPSFLFIHGDSIYHKPNGVPDFGITIMNYPDFHSSIVTIDDEPFIPHHYSEATNTFVCIGFGRKGDFVTETAFASNKPLPCTYHSLPLHKIMEAKPYGNFDTEFVVVGIKQHKLQVIPVEMYGMFYNKYREIATPKYLPLVPFQQAINIAARNPVRKWPRTLTTTLSKRDIWHKMFPWKRVHWAVGDIYQPRTHMFFRQVREVCTSSNCSKKLKNVVFREEDQEA